VLEQLAAALAVGDFLEVVRWKYDPQRESYYPATSQLHPILIGSVPATTAARPTMAVRESHSFPTSVRTGTVIIVTGSGGAAITAALSLLADKASMKQLRSRLNSPSPSACPNFDALIRIGKGDSLSRSSTIVLARSPQPLAPASIQTAAQSHQ
jgi:hypothetical protein